MQQASEGKDENSEENLDGNFMAGSSSMIYEMNSESGDKCVNWI